MASSDKHEKTILIYGLTPPELMTLAVSARRAGIRCIAVPDSMTTLRISQLLSGSAESSGETMHLFGKYALIDGFGTRLDEPAALINAAAPGVIKAMRTAHNENWRFADLCFSIQQEQNAIAKFRGKK